MAEKDKINRIKVVLVEKEVSQKELAENLTVTPNSIFRICKNESQPSLKLLKRIALILDVDIKDLLISTKEKK
jgi:putative transcriptional regulator